MYYKDLVNYNYYLPFSYDEVLCVGWLEKEHHFEQKTVSKEFIDKLEQIYCGNTNFDVTTNQMRGIHVCHICGEDETKIYCNNKQRFELLGSSEMWIPSKENLLND